MSELRWWSEVRHISIKGKGFLEDLNHDIRHQFYSALQIISLNLTHSSICSPSSSQLLVSSVQPPQASSQSLATPALSTTLPFQAILATASPTNLAIDSPARTSSSGIRLWERTARPYMLGSSTASVGEFVLCGVE